MRRVRRALVDAVSEAFTTPLQPEDLFQLSRDLDKVINGAKNTVREAEAMEFPRTGPPPTWPSCWPRVRHLQAAFGALGLGHGLGHRAADAAVKSQRNLERTYRQAAGDLLSITDIAVVTARREFYRRISAISDDIVSVADPNLVLR